MRTFGKAGHEDPMATLCQMVVETQYEDLPENVVTCAKHSILDTLAVTVGGSAAEGIPESGLPGFEAEHLYGVLAPAGTPKEIVNKLNNEIVKSVQMPEVKKRFYDLGFDTFTSTPEQFGEYIKADIAKWAKIIKDSGVTAN